MASFVPLAEGCVVVLQRAEECARLARCLALAEREDRAAGVPGPLWAVELRKRLEVAVTSEHRRHLHRLAETAASGDGSETSAVDGNHRMITTTEVASLLGVGPRRVLQMKTSYGWRARRVGRTWLIDAADVETYRRSRE